MSFSLTSRSEPFLAEKSQVGAHGGCGFAVFALIRAMLSHCRLSFWYSIIGTLALSTLALVPFSKLSAEPELAFADEVQALVDRDSAIPPADGAILCIGSSSMRLWSDRTEEDLKPLSVVPLGFGGSKYRDVIAHFDSLVAPFEPRAILIYEGDNDVASGMTALETVRDALVLASMIHEQNPEIRIYFISIKPSTTRVAVWPIAEQANRMLAAVCEEDARLVYVDVATPLLSGRGEMEPDLFVEDGIHLNDKGYDRWAAAIRKVLIHAEIAMETADTD